MASNLGIDGLISGISTTDLIKQIMAAERKPLTTLQQKKLELQSKSDAWRDVNTRLNNLRNTVYNLQSSITFNGRKASVSDTSVVTVTANNGAAETSYNLEVLELAKAHTISSDAKQANISLGYSGTVKINGKELSITAADTLNSIADKINTTKDIGVSASVVQIDANNSKLILTSRTTGAGNDINLVDDNGILDDLGLFKAENEIQAATNSKLKVNGITIERATNVINDAIQGVTLNLKSAKPGTSIAVEVQADYDKIVDAVRKFVDQYNSTMSFIKDNLAYDDKTKVKGKLFGDSSLMNIQNQLRKFISKTVSGVDESVNQLSLIGISTGKANSGIDNAKSGMLQFDESLFREKLQNHFDDIAKLFGATVTNVASSKNGASVTASSQLSENYPVTSIIDGRTSSDDWGQGGGWSGEIPGWVEIMLARTTTINKINLYTVSSIDFPAATYGIKDFTLEYKDLITGEWVALKSFTGNTQGFISEEFTPVVTNAVRVKVNAANGDNDYARLVEVEVYEQNNGIFSGMNSSLFEWTRVEGISSKKQSLFKEQIEDLDKRIEALEERLENREKYYYNKFTAMEQALSKLQSQSDWLNAQINALNLYNNK